MDVHGSRGRRLSAALAFPLALALAGCVRMGPLAGRATDEWTKTYPLTAGGELHVRNTNGRVEITGRNGSTVEVHAVRIARAVTDEGARQLLPRVTIKEDITPARISLETERMGIMVGAGFEVQYQIKVPQGAVVDATTTNGQIVLSALDGKVTARSTNGGVKATDLSGPVDARSTNGQVAVDLKSLGPDKIYLGTTNGGVLLTLPDEAKADVTATWTNGGFSITGLKLDASKEARRRIEGTINGGGTPIELHTTNGGIRVRARAAQASTGEAEAPGLGSPGRVDVKHRSGLTAYGERR